MQLFRFVRVLFLKKTLTKKKRGSVIVTKSIDSASWIGKEGVLVLNKSGLWTSPVSKTTHRKMSTRPALAPRSNTVQIFSTKDLENARNAVALKKAAAAVPPPKPCECVELKQQNAKLEDGIMTQCRSNYRLKDDLRVMLERAQEFRNKGQQAIEELSVAEKQVRNLEQMLVNDRLIAKAKEKALQRQLTDMIKVQNETVLALKNANKLVRVLQSHVMDLEAEMEEQKQEKDEARARGKQLTDCLEELMMESEVAIMQVKLLQY